jgi:hypothetical protein
MTATLAAKDAELNRLAQALGRCRGDMGEM